MYKVKAILPALLVIGLISAMAVPMAMTSRASAQSSITLNGAGATFPAPLIKEWTLKYQGVTPNVSINYQAIGSGAGIKQLTAKTVDFGASDAPLSSGQRANFTGPVVHIPETIGSVVVAYNIPEFPNKGLKLTGPVIADIFLGKVKNWNDPEITQLNSGANLPNQPIVVVHRSDGSGTTFVWTSYLSLMSPAWNSTVGHGTAVQWPTGLGQSGNQGVANTVGKPGGQGTPYSIGYVELAYALTNGMTYASIQNKASNFIEPTLDSTKQAVQNAATQLPAGSGDWSKVSLLNAGGDQSYPIATFTYIILYQDMSANIKSQAQAQAVVDFIKWAITDGQNQSSALGYVPLPDSVVQTDLATLGTLKFGQTQLTVPEFPFAPVLMAVSFIGVVAYLRMAGKLGGRFGLGA